MVFKGKEDLKDAVGIYSICHIESGRIYIGQTRDRFIERYWHHVWKLRQGTHDNSHLQRAWSKYGESAFEFRVVEVVDDLSMIDDREIYYIIEARGQVAGCYNVADGGGGKSGVPMSDTAKRIVGAKNRQHNLGKRASDETKRKMSELRKGQPRPQVRSDVTVTDIASAKQMLMRGLSIQQVADELNLSVGVVNGLLCRNTWCEVFVAGWDEFVVSRSTYYRLTRDDAEIIRQLAVNGATLDELANKYNKTVRTIQNILSYKTFK